MTYYNQIPEDQNLRKTILILPKSTKEAILYEHKYKKFKSLINNEKICVLDYPFIEKHELIENNFNVFKPDNIAIQNPLNKDSYSKVNDIVNDFALAKWNIFTKVCQELGATKVSVRYKNIIQSQDFSFVFSRFISPLMFLSKEEKKNFKEDFLLNIKIDKEYDGLEHPDIEKAKNLVREKHLNTDSNIEALINDREGENPTKRSYVKLEFFKEISKNLETTSSLVIPEFCVGLKEQVEFAKALRKFTIEYEVQYPGYEPSFPKKIIERFL